MRSASAEFKRKMNNGGSFYQTGKVVFADGTELDLGAKDFYMAGNSFTDGAGTTAFPLGEAIAKKINISLVNDDDRFSEYDFFGAKITVYLNCALENGTESLLIGTFTVTEPEAYGTKVEVVATDDMYKADTDYLTDLEYPATIGAILTDSCSTLSIPLLSTRFTNDSFMVAEKPEGITHRQLWGMIAMIAGGNARMDERNRLQIVEYDFSYFETKQGLDGGSFKFTDGDSADGGNFTDYSSGDSIDGGDFAELNQYHYFHRSKAPTVATDDVVITGIQTEIGENVFLNGEEGYVLRIENSLIESNPEGALALIGARIIGLRFRPFTLEHASYPLAEFGDICYVSDRKGNVYQSVVTDIEFIYWGYTSIKCAADSPLRNSSKYTSGKTQAIVAARKETQKKLEAYDLQMQQLANLMSQSFGVFKTEEKQADGSVIYYMHNKPELSSSSTIWKMTADAFAVSTDGGQTWNSGMDAEGNAVVNVLSAVGINFDWAKGGTLKLGGENNVDGEMIVHNASGKEVCRISKDGLNAINAIIQGTIQSSKFVAEGTATRHAADYTEDDINRIKRIILGIVQPTIEDIEKYDFNGDACITLADQVACRRLLNGTDVSRTLDTTIAINPENAFGLLKTLGVFIATNGLYSKNINTQYLQVGGVSSDGTPSGLYVCPPPDEDGNTAGYLSGESGNFYLPHYQIQISHGVITGMFENNNYDYIVACGTSGNWTYIKWNSGLALCEHTALTGGNWYGNAWGGVYEQEDAHVSFSDYPFTFAEVPFALAARTTADTDDMNTLWSWIAMQGGNTTTPPKFQMVRGSRADIGHPYLKMIAIGRWK